MASNASGQIDDYAQALGISRQQYIQLLESVDPTLSGSSQSDYQKVASQVQTAKALNQTGNKPAATSTSSAPPFVGADTNQTIRNTGAYVLGEKAQYPIFSQANAKSGVGTTGTTITTNVPDKPTNSWANTPGLLGGKADVPTMPNVTPVTAVRPVTQTNQATPVQVSSSPPAAPGVSTTTAPATTAPTTSGLTYTQQQQLAAHDAMAKAGASAGGSVAGAGGGLTSAQRASLMDFADQTMQRFNQIGQQTQQSIRDIPQARNAIPGPEDFSGYKPQLI